MIMGIFAAVLSAAAVFFYLKYSSHQEYPVEKSIAVLPFVNNSNDPQQDYFADGMMDEILNHLYKVGGLRVISRTSSLTYKNSHKTSTEIANELGVANLLEGSVQKDGDHIRIIAQLINGKTDDHLWAETYVREFKDIFTIQSDIAQQITAALKIKIDPMVKQRIESKPTSNTEAYSLYLRASSMGLTMETSVALLEAAITLDSNFANAYAALAIHWLFRGGFRGDLTPQEVLRNALPMAQKALELNPDLAEAHQVLASINLWYKWDFESAGNEFNIIRRLNPSNPQTTLALTDYLLASGKFREALEISSTAYEKDSTSNLNRVTSAVANYFYGNVPVALQIISKSFTLSPDFYTATNFIRLHVYAGEYKKALLGFDKKRDLYGLNLPSLDLAYAAAAYYHTGHVDSTQQIIQLLKQRNDQSSIGSPSFCLAIIYSSMGENEQGIQWLQNAYKSHEVEMYWLNVEPPFKSLHSDPRFKELLGLIGFK
jgi:TolB-like protein/tetratricopeptide (TPR) repeat protein